jgi:hypothetical protein
MPPRPAQTVEDGFETSLSFQTVRTIIGRNNGTDRTSKKRHEKIEIDKFRSKRAGPGALIPLSRQLRHAPSL